jgi:sulfur-oxidizing protein SoxZ
LTRITFQENPSMSLPQNIKVRAAASGSVAEVRILMSHPMENGLRKGPDGKIVAADFVRALTVTIGGKTYLDAQFGGGISKDPYLGFRANDAKSGDKIVLTFEDNSGAKGSFEASVS